MTWCVSGDDNSCNHDNLDPYIEHIQGVFGNSVIVSLPTGQQIATAGGDTNWTDSNYTGYVLPLWLYDNLFSESNDSLPYGYWTSTSVSGSISEAWKVCYDGSLYINYVYDGLNSNGIRPVITISKSSMN